MKKRCKQKIKRSQSGKYQEDDDDDDDDEGAVLPVLLLQAVKSQILR